MLGVRNGPTDVCKASPFKVRRKEKHVSSLTFSQAFSRRRRMELEEDDNVTSLKRRPGMKDRVAEGKAVEEEKEEVFVPSAPLDLDSLGDASRTFTLQQVKRIVESAVKEREKQLREEYDNILMDRLDEQWRTFAKFNEYHVHKKLNESKYDYYS